MALIIIGNVLIFLQFWADLGSLLTGGLNYFNDLSHPLVFFGDLLAFSTYSMVGSIGILLLIIGINKVRKKKKSPTKKRDAHYKYSVSPIWQHITEVSDSPTTETNPHNKPYSKYFCRECSALIDQTTQKCTGCGIDYSEEEKEETKPQQKELQKAPNPKNDFTYTFLKENWLWFILAAIGVISIVTIALPDEHWLKKIIQFPLYAIGAFTIFIGIGTIINFLDEKNFIKQTWQGILIFIILVLSIIVLAI